MSVDILLATAGRLASATRSLAPQPGNGQAKSAVDGQENSDPTQLFGALLEKQQGKSVVRGEEGDTAATDGTNDTDDRGQLDAEAKAQAAAYALPQNILSLAANLPNLKGESSNSATGHAPVLAARSGILQSSTIETETVEGDTMPSVPEAEAVNAAPAKRKTDTTQSVQKASVVADAKSASRAGQVAPDPTIDSARNTSAATTDGKIADRPQADQPADNQSANNNAADRGSFQPQQTATKSSAAADGKAVAAAQQAVRVADIQVVSERSFGAVKTLAIRLDPGDLGQVTARIRVVPDGVEVHLVADKAQGAEALAADRSVIERALKSVGIGDDARISVTVADRNAAGAVQHTPTSQNTGQNTGQNSGQNAGQQQAFNMQGGFDGRSGAQSQAQAQFASGEGRQNGDSGQSGRERSGAQNASETAARDAASGTVGRSRGLVV